LGPALAKLSNVKFNVTKINQRGQKQPRSLFLSANGISNVRPSNKVSSREKWSDVLLCYKLEESTIAIKYKNHQRVYNARSKAEANNLLSSLRERVNAYHEDARKELQKRLKGGLDEKESFEAVPIIDEKYPEHANDDEIRKCVGQILLSRNSDFFNYKERICRFALTELAKVEELRKIMTSLKYKIFDHNMVKLSAVTNIKDPEENYYTLNIIESMIESACLPCHTDNIYKLLETETRSSNNDEVMKKISLLFQKPQKFFGIKRMLQSKNEWITAVVELATFPTKLLPSAKMECLLNTTRHIWHEMRRSYNRHITSSDFLPIVLFVLVKTSYKSRKIIISASDELFIRYLINPDALHDERGYYFFVFCAALEFIRGYDSEKIEERFSRFMQLKDWGFC